MVLMKYKKIYISLGSNEGDRILNIKKALDCISRFSHIEKCSSFYETSPVGGVEQNNFINAVCEISCDLTPEELLGKLKHIEYNILGRKDSVRWGPRIIDLDIILFGNLIVTTPNLVIPHLQMHLRKFVLIPLEQIASEMVHPVFNKTIKEILNEVKTEEIVKEV